MIGELPKDVLDALLETLPLEYSVLDENDKVLAWNKHKTRTFKRPEAALGLDVRKCHPRESLNKVEQILKEMKSGERDKARFWVNIPPREGIDKRRILIEYYALRDKEGKYLGCMEASQDITDLQELRGEKRLLD
ncbi:MAG: diguanylate cyclase [Candidatus Altiarchaeales archaeon ex4484_2]|nr:MAG: diguanylate cyclase [Candidatus Altiarchaeales archaeon ex4484_2]